MEKIMATFDGVLAGVTKFSNNKYIKSISDAMMALIGIMIFGSFAVIFRAFPIPSVAEFSSLSDLMCFLAQSTI